MLDENMDLLDRLLWIYLCNEVDCITVDDAISASKKAREEGLWDICKDYLKEELRESARLIASQMVDDEVYDRDFGLTKEEYSKKQERAKSGCKTCNDAELETKPIQIRKGTMFGDII